MRANQAAPASIAPTSSVLLTSAANINSYGQPDRRAAAFRCPKHLSQFFKTRIALLFSFRHFFQRAFKKDAFKRLIGGAFGCQFDDCCGECGPHRIAFGQPQSFATGIESSLHGRQHVKAELIRR